MKGIILAGGKATRLRPLTFVTNKHLLPVYNKPLIYYPLEAMVCAGMRDVLIITGPDHSGHFLNLLKSGKQFGLRLSYEIQEEAGGIAQAIGLAEDFADKGKILVVLGDNIFKFSLRNAVKRFEKQRKGAMIFGKEMPDCAQYGVIELDKRGNVRSVEEKPTKPRSSIAQIGIFMYDKRVFDFIRTLKPSARGEIEVSDLNNIYVRERSMVCEILDDWWVDAGTSFDELLRANMIVAQEYQNAKTKDQNHRPLTSAASVLRRQSSKNI